MTNPANAASREARALAFVAEFAKKDPVFAKGHEKQRIAEAREITALADEAASQPRDDANGRTSGWKCNCCQTVFTSQQQARRPDDNNGGPRCPYCKADGQYTYPYRLHDGDPCAGCGVAHDDVVTGPCCALHDTAPTDQAQRGGDVERIARVIASADGEDYMEDHARFDRYARAVLAALAQSGKGVDAQAMSAWSGGTVGLAPKDASAVLKGCAHD